MRSAPRQGARPILGCSLDARFARRTSCSSLPKAPRMSTNSPCPCIICLRRFRCALAGNSALLLTRGRRGQPTPLGRFRSSSRLSHKRQEVNAMTEHSIGTREEWLAAREELLAKEKEQTRRNDELSRQRRELTWVRIEKEY